MYRVEYRIELKFSAHMLSPAAESLSECNETQCSFVILQQFALVVLALGKVVRGVSV
jgi:hypothetical protein